MVTIQVRPETRVRLISLRDHPRESFDAVISRLIDFYDDPLTREDIKAIRESLQDLSEGRFFTHEQVKERYGIHDEKPYSVLYSPRAVKDLDDLSGHESGSPSQSEPAEDELSQGRKTRRAREGTPGTSPPSEVP